MSFTVAVVAPRNWIRDDHNERRGHVAAGKGRVKKQWQSRG